MNIKQLCGNYASRFLRYIKLEQQNNVPYLSFYLAPQVSFKFFILNINSSGHTFESYNGLNLTLTDCSNSIVSSHMLDYYSYFSTYLYNNQSTWCSQIRVDLQTSQPGRPYININTSNNSGVATITRSGYEYIYMLAFYKSHVPTLGEENHVHDEYLFIRFDPFEINNSQPYEKSWWTSRS